MTPTTRGNSILMRSWNGTNPERGTEVWPQTGRWVTKKRSSGFRFLINIPEKEQTPCTVQACPWAHLRAPCSISYCFLVSERRHLQHHTQAVQTQQKHLPSVSRDSGYKARCPGAHLLGPSKTFLAPPPAALLGRAVDYPLRHLKPNYVNSC